MPGYLLNWKRKRKDGFVWETLMRDIESTKNGIPVPAKWYVNRQQSIRQGDRVFVLAQGGPYLKPPQINGLIAAGYAEPVPAGKMAIRVGHVVYHDEGFRTGNYITAVLNTVLTPEQVLPVSELERTGNLRHVEWTNVQSPGAEIRPHRKLKMKLDVLPELEELWERHLEKIDFPVRTDPDEQAAQNCAGRVLRGLLSQMHSGRAGERDSCGAIEIDANNNSVMVSPAMPRTGEIYTEAGS